MSLCVWNAFLNSIFLLHSAANLVFQQKGSYLRIYVLSTHIYLDVSTDLVLEHRVLVRHEVDVDVPGPVAHHHHQAQHEEEDEEVVGLRRKTLGLSGLYGESNYYLRVRSVEQTQRGDQQHHAQADVQVSEAGTHQTWNFSTTTGVNHHHSENIGTIIK